MNKLNFNNIDYSKYRDEYITKLEGVFEEWKDSDYTENYPPNSIFFSEAFLVYCLAKEFKIDLLIESGVYRGGSTSIWLNTLPDIKIVCVDILESKHVKERVEHAIDRFSNRDNIEFIIGDGMVEVPKLIEKYKDKKIGMFIDGPKGTPGLELISNSLKSDNVYFSCLHDYQYLNDDKQISTRTNDKLRLEVGDMDSGHPQYNKYPNGPGLYGLLK